ncbi:hypothetical protein KI387_014427, partial [Taxus chinensis]
MDRSAHIFCFLFGPTLLLALALCGSHVEAQTQSRKPLVSALYVFGDSTIDPGNNNQLNTVFKANFPPYGRDFLDGRPTGRFTDGKLITDIISGLVGLPDLLPAYLDSKFHGEKLLTGASFGSAGAGLADSTSLPVNVIPLRKQLENFRRYRSQLTEMIRRENASRIVSQALFGISMGTNDYVDNYYSNPVTRNMYSLAQFEDLLHHSLTVFIENVYREGATRLVVVGLPPFGCCPLTNTLHNFLNNSCDEEMNQAATSFNNKTTALIDKMNLTFPGLRIYYFDIYQKLYDIIKYPNKY